MREFINKSKQVRNIHKSDVEFNVEENLFNLKQDKNEIVRVSYNIEPPDEFFDEEYLSLYGFETKKIYRRMGYGDLLLSKIFNYLRANTKIKIITLIVDKINQPALNLYFKHGFKIYSEYEDGSYSLIKKI